jgi:LemA protein
MAITIVVLVIIVVLVVAVINIYNGIVSKRNRCDNAWQNVSTQLQRRNDLIPNLVSTVKGYAAHEKSTFEAVTEARAAVTAAATPHEVVDASNQLTAALRQLLAVAEAYPELKANTNFLSLQEQLADTENKISYARQSYNDCVLNYNNAIQTFPGNLVAGIGNFTARDGFDVTDPSAADVPNVSF